MSASLATMMSLQRLGLGGNELGAAGAGALCPALGRLTGLQRLGLAGNMLGEQGAAALAPAVALLSDLRRLDLSNNRIGRGGAMAVVSSVLAPCLEQLAVSEEERGQGVWDAGAFLGAVTRLHKLHLQCEPPK